jgi:prefoldin subunit 5
MKEEINKDIEILKNNQSEVSSSISQIKISIEILMNRMEQVKNSVRNGRQRRGSISNSQRP